MAGVSTVFSLGKIIGRRARRCAEADCPPQPFAVRPGDFLFRGAYASLAGHTADGRAQPDRAGVFFHRAAYLFFPPRALIAICAGLLIGYWALMTFVPFPDVRPTPQIEVIAKETGFTKSSQLNLTGTNFIREPSSRAGRRWRDH